MWVNAKSILGVMTLAAECGSEVTVRAEGEDAREAIATLIELLSRDFADEYLLEEEVGE